MAKPNYDKLKTFGDDIAKAVKHALGENGKPSDFKDSYKNAASAFTGATDAVAFEGFVLPMINPFLAAVTAYQTNQLNINYGELGKTIGQIRQPRDLFAANIPDSELSDILTIDELNRYNEAVKNGKDDAVRETKENTILGKL